MYRAFATAAWVLLLAGWTQRKRRRVHVPLVLAGMAIDFTIVLVLELQRSVVADAVTKDWSVTQATHICSSSLAVLLYLPTLYLGFRLLRGPLRGPMPAGVRRWHRLIATAALVARTVGFACMWGV